MEQEQEGKSKLLTILVTLTLVISLVSLYSISSLTTQFNDITGGAVAAAPQPSAPTPSAPAPKVEVSADDDAFKGDPNAPVTIIEFSDFECPFCTRWYSQTLPQIQTEYIDTGKVKLVYRDFPLGFHPNAQKAGEAAECAKNQDKFWEMHDMLFESGVEGGVQSFKGYAGTLGLDQATFDECLDSGEEEAEVKADMKDGQSYGVTGTPGFFINGIKLVGAQPFAAFQQIIESELNK